MSCSGPELETGQAHGLSDKYSRLREAISILVLISVLAGFGLAGHVVAGIRRNHELRDTSARLYLQACEQRDLLVSAIETYRRQLGFYPPDHLLSKNPLAVDATTNQLLYELLGSVYDTTNDTFASPHMSPIHRDSIKAVFGTDSIRNAVSCGQAARCFLEATNLMAIAPVSRGSDPIGLIAVWPNWAEMRSELYQYFEVTPWHYTSLGAVHNRESFDLWIEVRTPQTNIFVSNW